jgi:tetratricopeptide (TPR) repeat protein
MRKIRIAIAALAVAAAALAGMQGRLNGTVTDPEGKPLEGVTITVTTPNIASFKMTAKTDKKGQFGIIVNDATIPYRLHFEKEGFNPYEDQKKPSTVETTTVNVKLSRPTAQAAPAQMSTTDQAATAYNAGVELLNAGDKAGAAAKFEEAAKKNPDLPQAWQALTVVAYQNKDWAKVLSSGEKATELDPSMTNLYQMMAEAAGAQGDKKAADEYKAKFAAANPDSAETIYNKGVESLNAKKMQEAADYFAKAVEAKPDFAMAHYQLGVVSLNLKKNADAKEHLQKYLELDPNGKEAETAKELLEIIK